MSCFLYLRADLAVSLRYTTVLGNGFHTYRARAGAGAGVEVEVRETKSHFRRPRIKAQLAS